MKNNLPFIVVIGFVFILVAGIIGYIIGIQLTNNQETVMSFEENLSMVDESDYVSPEKLINTNITGTLTESEIEGLLLMREEEKLAHDVYTILYEKWGLSIFSNISDSEQTHTDSVKALLDKYEVEDPYVDSLGKYENQELQKISDNLIEIGGESVEKALEVGATVEDLDIKDLQDLMGNTTNEDIISVYNNLQKGSRNHLRSFTRMLDRYGVEYAPNYITQDEYLEIITSPYERGSI